MLTSCSNIIIAVQACIEAVVGLITTAVAALSLRNMLSLYTWSIHESVDALCEIDMHLTITARSWLVCEC